MRLSSVLAEKRTVEIDIEGEKLTVTYLPGAFTPELEDKFMSSSEKNRGGGALAEFLLGLVSKWDLQDEDDSVYPITLEALRQLPLSFLNSVVEGITDDINPKKAKGKTSTGTSLRKGD